MLFRDLPNYKGEKKKQLAFKNSLITVLPAADNETVAWHFQMCIFDISYFLTLGFDPKYP